MEGSSGMQVVQCTWWNLTAISQHIKIYTEWPTQTILNKISNFIFMGDYDKDFVSLLQLQFFPTNVHFELTLLR